jgi:uncharacterized beta-barrel protein YwiB (DUF1934 family)
MEKKKIDLKIITNQRDRENSEKMELVTEGLYWKQDDGYCIEYKETRTTGFEGSVTTIKAEKDSVYVSRSGDYAAALVIEKNREHYGHYITPVGSLDVGTRAYGVKNALNDKGGTLYMQYGVYLNGTFMNLTKMLVEVRVIENTALENKEEEHI